METFFNKREGKPKPSLPPTLKMAAPPEPRVIVVDDGSAEPLRDGDFADAPGEVAVIRHPVSRGPAAARNTGLTAAGTDFVAFLDSDVVPRRGWLEALLGHFSDPAVALVAPRIVGLDPQDNPVARYEMIRSSLDLGHREAPVLPYSTVSYVPSAAIICRRAVISDIGGFDEAMTCGEDVDLCWRMAADGWRLRYDPVARVAHEHRVSLSTMLDRRRFYGTGAALLADRHDRKAAPLVMKIPTAVALIALLTRTRLGLLIALLCAGYSARGVYERLDPLPRRECVSASLTTAGLGNGLVQVGSVVCRHYWPLALLAALVSQRLRRLFLQIAIVDALIVWVRFAAANRRRPAVDPVSFFVLRRLDDLAYGAGLWQGALREHDPTALLPVLVR